jgi:tripartite-type tricarboxylate transporter receptor subunit TctC
MKLPRRRFLCLAGAAALPAVPRVAKAQSYPNKPVRWLIGFLPGSAADTVARIMGRWLSGRLGQPVIIENRPGAATNISVQAGINSPPDGYTLIYLSSSTVINATLYESLPFDIRRDVAPVAGVIEFNFVMVVNPSVPASTVAEFVAYAKANPHAVGMASFGTGTTSHLFGELFKAMTGTDMLHVPYRGSGPAHIDLISGRVQVMFDTLTASLPYIRSGALRALAVGGPHRYEALPELPTVGETIAGYSVSGWGGIGAPRGTPPEIVERLNREINAGLTDPTVIRQLADVATTPLVLTPAQFGELLTAELEKWAKVVKLSGAKSE